MTLTSLLLFAAVYFAAVATPGTGRRGARRARARPGTEGRRAVHRRLFRRRHGLAHAGRDGPRRRRQDLRRRVRRDQIRRRRLSALSRVEDGDRAGRDRRSGAAAGLARLARVPRLAVADARQSEGDGLLPVDHAARRRRQGADACSRSSSSPRVCGGRHFLDARRSMRSPRTGRGRSCVRRGR